MTDADFIVYMNNAIRATPQAEIEARQILLAPLMHGLSEDELAALYGDGLRNRAAYKTEAE